METKERSQLLYLSVDEISPNPENPRLIFDQDKLDILAESISEVGILVPLIVYREEDGRYIILDGERRWRCARRINLKEVPVNIIATPSKIENVLRMFNIHNVREEWELMPTALKLGELMNELRTTNERRLGELTSLTPGTIRRCKILLSLPKKYQKGVLNGEFKADFFIEMEVKALRKIQTNLPRLYERYGRDGLIDLFVNMQKKGKIKSVTDFRLLQKVLQAGDIGLDSQVVEDLATRVIVEQEMDFRESYEVIENLVNVSKVEEKALRLTETFRSFRYNALTETERVRLRNALIELRETIDDILRNL